MRGMLLTIILALALAMTPPVAPACHICGSAGNSALNPHGVVGGRSCATWVMTLYRQRNETICQSNRVKFKSCCDGSNLKGAPTNAPTRQPVMSVFKTGPNPVCHLCVGKAFPAKPNNIINLLYIGQGSCKEYYFGGLRGDIPPFLCDPLRYFASDPCGCSSSPSRARGIGSFDNEDVTVTLPFLFILLFGFFGGAILVVVAKLVSCLFPRARRPPRRT